MSLGNLNIAVVLKLVEQVSGPARAAEGALRRIGDLSEQTGRASVDWANRQLEANRQRQAALQGEALRLAAMGASLIGLTEPAIQAERRLAEVSKVVTFDSPEGLSILQRDIRELVTSGGLAATADGMTDIVAAAARMGMVEESLPDAEKRKQLLEFATDAAKMAAAFGITAEESGTTMARWRQNLRLNREEALLLGDIVNGLGNSMATSEADILEVINRQGVVAKTAGLAKDEIAALSATILAAGAAPEVAATGLKNFTNALNAGSSVTKREAAVYARLGLDPEVIAKRMHEDASATILQVIKAFDKVPVHMRNAMVGDLFGEEAKGAIMPLIDNVSVLEEAFMKAADGAAMLGLMEEEYQRQAATTFVQRQRLIEYLKGLSVVVGTAVLPQLNDLMETVMPVVSLMTDWAAAHPELINRVLMASFALFGFKLASIALRWTLYALLPPLLHLVRATGYLMILGPRLGRALLSLLTPMGLVRGAFVALRFAFLATGIGALLAGIAMAGIWIYNNWAGLQAFFEGFWQGFRAALGPAGPMLDDIAARAKRIWDWFAQLVGPLDAAREDWAAWGNAAGGALGDLVARLSQWSGINGDLLLSIGGVYLGFATLRAIWWLPLAPVVAAGKLLAWVARGPIRLLIAGTRLLGAAFVRLGALALANPIGLIIASVAALAFVVYQNWDQIVGYLTEKVERVRAAFDEGLIKGVFKLLAEFNPFTLAVEGAIGLVAYVLELLGVPEQIIDKFREFSLHATGVTLMKSLWDGMGSIVDQAVSYIAEKFKALKPQWLTDLQNWISADSAPASVAAANPRSGRAGAPALPRGLPGRDNGGPVRAGEPYMVGERGKELFIPGVSGSILPTRVVAAAMTASVIAAGAPTAVPAAEIERRVDRRPALQAASPAPNITRQGDTFVVNVSVQSGGDAEMIAKEVRRALQRMQNERRSSLHDGVDY